MLSFVSMILRTLANAASFVTLILTLSTIVLKLGVD